MGWPKGKSRKPVTAETVTETAPQPEPQAPKKKWTAKKTATQDATSPADEKRRKWVTVAKSRWADTEWRDNSSDNLFELPEEIKGWLVDQDLDCNWKTKTVYGMEMTTLFRRYLENGWEPIPQEIFPDFEVERGGMVCCVRPMSISRKARKLEMEKARQPILDREQMLGISGVPGVTGGDHPSALRHNKIRRSVEKIEIPRGD